jgi:hypothetical protein
MITRGEILVEAAIEILERVTSQYQDHYSARLLARINDAVDRLIDVQVCKTDEQLADDERKERNNREAAQNI